MPTTQPAALLKDKPLRTLVVIRSHKADTETLAAYDRYATLKTADVMLCCDERNGVVDAGARAKAFYNLDTLAEMGLLAHPNCGWRCGDYAYYAARAARPDYDFYWMIEPDVMIRTADLNAMFEALNTGTADLLAARFCAHGPTTRWGWYKTMCQQYPAVYGCIFPITRLSGRAIDHLYQARRTASVGGSEELFATWPNDEVFVATELKNHGFECRDLGEQRDGLYQRGTLRIGLPHDRAQLMAQPLDEQIYHPVRDLGAWITVRVSAATDIGQRFRASTEPLRENHMKALTDLTNIAMEHEALQDIALFPLLLTRSRPIAPDLTPKAKRRYTVANKTLRLHFAANRAEPAVATGYRVIGITAEPGDRAAPTDLILDEGMKLRRIPRHFALPYAFDFENQTLLYTVHPQPGALLEAKSLREEQLQLAAVVISISWQTLKELDPLEAAPGMTRIVSTTDRVPDEGWTILRDLPALAQLDAERAQLKTLGPLLRRALILAAATPYLTAFAVSGNIAFRVAPRIGRLLGNVAEYLPNYVADTADAAVEG